MPFIASIASRIFGLAVGLVLLMILLVAFLLWQVTVLSSELQQISSYFAPLDRVLNNLNEVGLRRRIAFERLLGGLTTTADRAEAIADASRSYETYTALAAQQIENAQQLLAHPPPVAEEGPMLIRLRALLDQIDASFEIVTTRQAEILDLVRRGELSRGVDLLRLLDDYQALLQTQRSDVQKLTADMIAALSAGSARKHAHIFWTTVIATFTSVLLGLTVAALTTRRLVEPVRSLIRGLATVEGGDLSIELPVRSSDEIGRLTQSFNYFIGELRRKEELRRTFGKYIDPRILDRVLAGPDAAPLAGERQVMAVSFGDLVGFTNIGEQLTPAGVVNLLNQHFTLQAEAIQACHGVVDKFMGDAVMAFWGDPFIGGGNRALLSCRSALAQVRAVEEIQRRLPEITGLRKNLPRVDARIGISTGEVVVGNIGSENTQSYTVIGDSVNLAARLEAANRFYGTQILICESTRREAGDAIVAREIDTLVVHGKEEPTTAFSLVGLRDEVSLDDLRLCEHSTTALAAYRLRHWDDAEEALQACLELRPDDRPSLVLKNRIQKLRENPPPPDWKGEWELHRK
ncbi:MAG TPA: adenylate/guanylate cyclase domain-containing protein [Chthoniobacterales bacterium]|jgi:adenylate cyclase